LGTRLLGLPVARIF